MQGILPKGGNMYHTIIIVGSLGKDPEMRYTPSGQAVTSCKPALPRKVPTPPPAATLQTVFGPSVR